MSRHDDIITEKILKKVRTGFADVGEKEQGFVTDTITFPANVKFSWVRDKDVLVVHDVPITKVGVQTYIGDDGMPEKHLKTEGAIKGIKSDFSPISFSHPDLHFRDMDDVEAKETMIGYTSEGRYDAAKQARVADLYFMTSKLTETDEGKELIDRVTVKNISTDVSIGFFVETERTAGDFNGQKYDVQQTSIDYDHLAVLVDEQGRYSFPDGIGIGADRTEKTTERGKATMSNDKKNAPDPQDVFAREISDAREQAKKAADENAVLKDKLSEQEKKFAQLEKDMAGKAAKDHVKRVDAFVERIQKGARDEKFDGEEAKKVLASLDSEQLTWLEGFIGDSFVVRDNSVSITPKDGNDSKQGGKSKKDYTQIAKDAMLKSHRKANNIPEPDKE